MPQLLYQYMRNFVLKVNGAGLKDHIMGMALQKTQMDARRLLRSQATVLLSSMKIDVMV